MPLAAGCLSSGTESLSFYLMTAAWLLQAVAYVILRRRYERQQVDLS